MRRRPVLHRRQSRSAPASRRAPPPTTATFGAFAAASFSSAVLAAAFSCARQRSSRAAAFSSIWQVRADNARVSRMETEGRAAVRTLITDGCFDHEFTSLFGWRMVPLQEAYCLSFSSNASPHCGQNFGGCVGSSGVQPRLSQR